MNEIKKTSTISFKIEILNSEKRAPLYESEDWFTEVCMDTNGVVYLDNEARGGGYPDDKRRQRLLTWDVNSRVDAGALQSFLLSPDTISLFERVRGGHRVEWDGNTDAGVLDDDAYEAFNLLANGLRGLDYALVSIWDACDFLQGVYAADMLKSMASIGGTLHGLAEHYACECEQNSGTVEVDDLLRVISEKLLDAYAENRANLPSAVRNEIASIGCDVDYACELRAETIVDGSEAVLAAYFHGLNSSDYFDGQVNELWLSPEEGTLWTCGQCDDSNEKKKVALLLHTALGYKSPARHYQRAKIPEAQALAVWLKEVQSRIESALKS
ncbi:hypothetical protein [Roseateles albus]|uniref:Uncharacterized protein n=1 Tax=Roseateles albus TaxID=2987525 RepID=A0ABT5KAI2_9BURK|nr:hypothetical protein [Roseateles albus]MDC8770928.1 hypothetical protein [Roseateles albus]